MTGASKIHAARCLEDPGSTRGDPLGHREVRSAILLCRREEADLVCAFRPTLPDLDEAYRRYRGLLLSALRRFAARSMPVPPDQGIDLIHDFFTDEWRGLQRRFDPDRGEANAYVYSAFVRFVNARLISAARMREVPLREWRWRIVDATQETRAVHGEEIARLKASLAEIPDLDRRMLLRFAEPGQSERALARDFELSRHAVREHLIESIGHLVLTLVAPRLPSGDRAVVEALWTRGHTVDEAARLFRVPVTDVREIQDRCKAVFEGYLNALRDRRSPHAGEDGKRGGSMNLRDAIRYALSEAPLGSTDYEKALERLEHGAEEVLALLETMDDAGEIRGDSTERSRRAEAFYEALAAGLIRDTVDAHVPQEAVDPFSDERAAMAMEAEGILGKTHRGTESLADLLEQLEDGDRLDDVDLAHFLRQPDVAASTEKSVSRLAPWGVGPASLWAARRCLSDIIDRTVRSGAAESKGPDLVLRPDGVAQGDTLIVEVQSILPVIASRAEVSPGVAGVLYAWFLHAGEYNPHLFPGMVCESVGPSHTRSLAVRRESDRDSASEAATDLQRAIRFAVDEARRSLVKEDVPAKPMTAGAEESEAE